MRRNDYQTLIRPLVTEKNMQLHESENKVFFEVAPDANRIEIKRAVERVFKVKVEKVNVLNQNGKRVRFKMKMGKRKDWKKAIVTLKEGQKVDYLES
ncbi:MAG: 50S ribosomal protein L23 [Deltaproteobacteria bacterium]|nr:50S ribosomal protein L23 [Deltaproteobacteria bacterium]